MVQNRAIEKRKFRFLVAFLVLFLVMMGSASWTVWAADEDNDFDITGGPVNIPRENPEAPCCTGADPHVITGKPGASPITIQGRHYVRLEELENTMTYGCAFYVKRTSSTKNPTNVTLELTNSNTLTSGDGKAGLQVDPGAALTIKGTGSLTATGGKDGGAGIGGESTKSCGTITIESGTIEAKGKDGGAGIGGGKGGGFDNISIQGGTITAKGGGGVTGTRPYGGAGIGCGGNGSGNSKQIEIGAGATMQDIQGGGTGSGVSGPDIGPDIGTNGTSGLILTLNNDKINNGLSSHNTTINCGSGGKLITDSTRTGPLELNNTTITGSNFDSSQFNTVITNTTEKDGEPHNTYSIYGTVKLEDLDFLKVNDSYYELSENDVLSLRNKATLILPEDKEFSCDGKIENDGTLCTIKNANNLTLANGSIPNSIDLKAPVEAGDINWSKELGSVDDSDPDFCASIQYTGQTFVDKASKINQLFKINPERTCNSENNNIKKLKVDIENWDYEVLDSSDGIIVNRGEYDLRIFIPSEKASSETTIATLHLDVTPKPLQESDVLDCELKDVVELVKTEE